MNYQRQHRIAIEPSRTFKAGFGYELGQQLAAILAALARLAIIAAIVGATLYGLHAAGWAL